MYCLRFPSPTSLSALLTFVTLFKSFLKTMLLLASSLWLQFLHE